jgi:Site-specific recombinase XerD
MSSHPSFDESSLSRLESHLRCERYTQGSSGNYLAAAKRFLEYLANRHIAVEAVEPSDVSRYLRRELGLYRQRHGHAPESVPVWHSTHARYIHLLLGVVKGQWPPIAAPATPIEAFQQALCQDYAQSLLAIRGLAGVTIGRHCAEARRFLAWLGERSGKEKLPQLAIAATDAYLASRASSLSRRTRKGIAIRLHSFLRYLRAAGYIRSDLASTVIAPKGYALETIPSALRPEHVRAVLESTRQDRSAKGLRDYAILMLLSTYGLRAGEAIGLRLDELNWRKETLRIRHSKTGTESFLPLLGPVGEAILAYLKNGRPKTQAREVFIRTCAPYRPLRRSALWATVHKRLQQAGVHSTGKGGPHAFRHARALSLLRAAIPPKQIGDILGHRSAASTATYLKLATEDLRAVALEIPGETKTS